MKLQVEVADKSATENLFQENDDDFNFEKILQNNSNANVKQCLQKIRRNHFVQQLLLFTRKFLHRVWNKYLRRTRFIIRLSVEEK